MKKLVLVSALALTLAACGSNNEETAPVVTPPAEQCQDGAVYDEGKGGCVPATETPAVEAETVPAEGVTATADPAVAPAQ